MQATELPIDAILPALRAALRERTAAVLQAPPGAGKTTRVPLALLDEPWLAGRRVLMLEPRRLAARAAATRMASLLGEPVGRTVGYRIRMESRVGPETRIEVVTEGILTRMLQGDPALEGFGAILFDEFHERSVHADLGLALALQCRTLLREELRLLIMSATLDGEPVAALLQRALGEAPAVLSSEGRAHPVETRYLDRPVEGWIEPAVARVVERALREEPGDLLVFLPGAGEIRRVELLLREGELPPGTEVLPLHGSLPQAEQDRAIRPASGRERRVVLSTSIAETSLTIEGVRVVVDSGLMRVPRFSPRTGMTRLETVTVTRASADQRRGRAGRVGPGVCYRLWTEAQHGGLMEHGVPEIAAADLAPLALELAAWGVAGPEELHWLDVPAPAAYAQAMELLEALGAVRAGTITPHGREMARLGAHPRLAHMLLRSREMGLGSLACELAALLAERDLLRGEGGPPDADLRLRVEALRGRGSRVAGFGVDGGGAHRARTEARHWRQRLGVADRPEPADSAGALLALAYPDRVAQRRDGEGGRYLLRNGRGAALAGPQGLAREPYLAVAEVDGQGRDSRILLAAPLALDELETLFADALETTETIAWDDEAGAVRALRETRLGALVLRQGSIADPDPDRIANAVAEAVRRRELDPLAWTPAARQLQQRAIFLRNLDRSVPDLSDAALAERVGDWLVPHLRGIRRLDQLRRLDLAALLGGQMEWRHRRDIDEMAPTHLTVPSGSRIPIDYADPDAPTVAVRLQEMFGLAETPRVGGGRVPLVIQLLSPAQRPVQVTRDLASFWRDAYFEVRKDLRGRYPRHHWPENPMEAEATRRAKRRGE